MIDHRPWEGKDQTKEGDKDTVLPMQQIRTINNTHFEQIFQLHYDGLFRYCNTMISIREDVEDIVQAVFMDLWQQRQQLVIHTSIQAYLYKAVYFKCMNKIKHNKVVQKFENSHSIESISETSDPLILKEVSQKIETITHNLPEQCKKIFTMNRVDGLRYNEIAAQLNLSPKTVENQIGKALKMMRNALAEYLNLIILTISTFWS